MFYTIGSKGLCGHQPNARSAAGHETDVVFDGEEVLDLQILGGGHCTVMMDGILRFSDCRVRSVEDNFKEAV